MNLSSDEIGSATPAKGWVGSFRIEHSQTCSLYVLEGRLV